MTTEKQQSTSLNIKGQTPKFKKGQTVDTISSRISTYKGCKGIVTEIERAFKEIDEDGNWVLDGLVTMESSIPSISLPYQYDGQTLVVEHPESNFGGFQMEAYTRKAKPYEFVYTVKISKEELCGKSDANILVGEEQIRGSK